MVGESLSGVTALISNNAHTADTTPAMKKLAPAMSLRRNAVVSMRIAELVDTDAS